jgi:tripartite ATP-independent transporter DctP family solute receptor
VKKMKTSSFLKIFLTLILAVVVFIPSAYCETDSSSKPITLVFSTSSMPDVSYTKVLYDVVKPELEKKTNGEVTLEIHDSSSLFSQDDELPATIRGNVDMCYTDATWLADYLPSMNMLAAGYMFKNQAQMSKVLNGEIGREIFEDATAKVGVRPLFAYYIGARMVVTRSDKKIITPDDLKGLKLRMPNSEAWLFLGEAIGANPVPIAFSELYTALQSGTVDGLENPLAGLEEGKFYEVTKAISLTNHMIGAVWPCINEKKWQSLTPEQQSAVTEAFLKGLVENDKMALADEEALLTKYKELGMTIVTPDIDAFKAKVDAAYLGNPEKVGEWNMELYERILSVGE